MNHCITEADHAAPDIQVLKRARLFREITEQFREDDTAHVMEGGTVNA